MGGLCLVLAVFSGPVLVFLAIIALGEQLKGEGGSLGLLLQLCLTHVGEGEGVGWG